MTNAEKIRQLIDQLNLASSKYYGGETPLFSDAEWDKMYDELAKLEKETGIIFANSPTQKVGGNVKTELEPHKHLYRLYSMDKAQSIEELKMWFEKNKKVFKDYNQLPQLLEKNAEIFNSVGNSEKNFFENGHHIFEYINNSVKNFRKENNAIFKILNDNKLTKSQKTHEFQAITEKINILTNEIHLIMKTFNTDKINWFENCSQVFNAYNFIKENITSFEIFHSQLDVFLEEISQKFDSLGIYDKKTFNFTENNWFTKNERIFNAYQLFSKNEIINIDSKKSWDKYYSIFMNTEIDENIWFEKNYQIFKFINEKLNNFHHKNHHLLVSFNFDENNIGYSVEYKLDGLTLNLTYEDGVLVQAATRGDGTTGQAILVQAKTIKGIPLTIPYKGKIEIQGECIMTLSAFKEFNESHDEKLKDPRNAAAGAVLNLDPKLTASRNLSAYFYNIGSVEETDVKTQEGLIEFLKENHFPTSSLCKICTTFEDIEREILHITDQRHKLNFLIDGVVIKLNDIAYRNLFGYTEKFPKWAIAYKFKAEESTTVLNKVSWQVGKSGKVTPLAHLKPIKIGNVTVSKATLNNFEDIRKKKLALHCDVVVRRSNDVIPEIMGRANEVPFKNEKDILPPTCCPSCGRPLVKYLYKKTVGRKKEDKRTYWVEAPELFCLGGFGCKAQNIEKIAFFCSKQAMNIDGLSVKTIELLFNQGIIRNYADIYKLTSKSLKTLDGFKDKKINNLLLSIEKSKHVALENFLYAINIPNVGKTTAYDIAVHFRTLSALEQASLNELKKLNDIGDKVASTIFQFFRQKDVRERIDDVLKYIKIEEKKLGTAQILSGKKIVLTGTLPNLKRDEAQEIIKQHGGKVSSNVGKDTAFVVAGEKAGSKYEKALKLNIPIKTEAEFLALIEEN